LGYVGLTGDLSVVEVPETPAMGTLKKWQKAM
jgi:hypothetical protein